MRKNIIFELKSTEFSYLNRLKLTIEKVMKTSLEKKLITEE
jgi:hypothetical protein